MSLPIYFTASKDINLLQTTWSTQLNPIISSPINQGNILKSITLTTGSNQVNHLLGRNLQGWFICRQRSSASIYDTQDSNPTPTITLQLVTSADVSVDIFVF